MTEAEAYHALLLRTKVTMHEWRTMTARPRTDIILHTQHITDQGRRKVCNVQAYNRCPKLTRKIAINRNPGNFMYHLIKPPRKTQFPAPDIVHPFLLQIVQTSLQTSQTMHIHRAGLQMLRHQRRMMRGKGLAAAAAGLQFTKLQTMPDTNAACPLRPHKPFMSGKTQHIDMLPLHMDGEDTCCLGSIDQKKPMVFRTDLSNPGKVNKISGKI